MSISEQFTEDQRATLEAAFKIILEAMQAREEQVFMLTSEVSGPGSCGGELLISHFVRGDSTVALAALGVGSDQSMH